jgi:hypothetical protein
MEIVEEQEKVWSGKLVLEYDGGNAGGVEAFRQALDNLLPFAEQLIPVKKLVSCHPQQEAFPRFAVDPAGQQRINLLNMTG